MHFYDTNIYFIKFSFASANLGLVCRTFVHDCACVCNLLPLLYLLKETLWVITGAAALQSIILFDRKIAEIFIQVYEDIMLFQEMAAAII